MNELQINETKQFYKKYISHFILLHPLASHIVRDNLMSLISCLSLAQPSILTMWFSYHVISFQLHICSTSLPWCTAIPLFTNHNMTACQSTWGHQKRTQNPCQLSLYNIPLYLIVQNVYIWTFSSHLSPSPFNTLHKTKKNYRNNNKNSTTFSLCNTYPV